MTDLFPNRDPETCGRCGHEIAAGATACARCGFGPGGQAMTAERAQQLAAEIIKGCSVVDGGWTYIARRLHIFDSARAWEHLGHKSLREWIDATPLRITALRGMQLLRTYRFFVVEHQVPEDDIADTPPSRLQRLVTPVRDGQVTAPEAAEEAKVFTEHELAESYHGTTPERQRPSTIRKAVETLKQEQLPGFEASMTVAIILLERVLYDRLVDRGVLRPVGDGMDTFDLDQLVVA